LEVTSEGYSDQM